MPLGDKNSVSTHLIFPYKQRRSLVVLGVLHAFDLSLCRGCFCYFVPQVSAENSKLVVSNRRAVLEQEMKELSRGDVVEG